MGKGENGAGREVPAVRCQPRETQGGLRGAEVTMAELSSHIQQHQQEMEFCQSQGQREAVVLEPQHGGAQTRQDSQQQDTPAFLQMLQVDLDICRDLNSMRLAQLHLQQRVVEQKHQDLISQKHRYQAMMEQDQKDTSQIEATSAYSCSSSGASNDLLEEYTEQLEQVAMQAGREHCRQRWEVQEHQYWSSTGHSTAKEEAQGRRRQCQQAALSRAAQVPARSLAAQSCLQHKKEQLQPHAGSTMQCTEEQPCSCAKSSMQHTADSSIVEPRAPQEVAESREMAVWLQMELSQWQQKQQVTLEQSLQHMHAAAHAKQELQKSQEQLQALKKQLKAQKEQNRTLQHSLEKQQEVLTATKAREMQSLQQLSRHKQTIHDLQQKAASSRKKVAELLQQVEEVASLKAELAQAQRKIGHNLPLLCRYEKERQQLHRELEKQQRAQVQSQQEARSFQEKLQKLSSQVQYWQELHQDTQQTLARREDELSVCNAEMDFKEEFIKAMRQAQARNRQNQNHSPRAGGVQPEPQAPLKDRSWPTGRTEVERPGHEWVNCRANKGGGGGSVKTLHSSHTPACSNRLHQDRNLMLINNSQNVKEQMQSNEKQHHKIQQQVKQAAEFTGKNQHLQDTLDSLHVENTYFRSRTHVQYHNHEQMKALQGNNLTARALQNLAGLSLPGTYLQDEKLHKTTEGLKTHNL
ncbi:polyamine-modulated factor 1-binding protein 1 [Phasianus colchicus]|uniref:polyamine-modulated factor 1-binding protein 1 n=1 Tax=Phasianus colchicus TaxID=9054 RepID=UPI00129EC88C|nr:polyamine-modulated factor 1-binding protein 1 [Phasianus colchicus]